MIRGDCLIRTCKIRLVLMTYYRTDKNRLISAGGNGFFPPFYAHAHLFTFQADKIKWLKRIRKVIMRCTSASFFNLASICDDWYQDGRQKMNWTAEWENSTGRSLWKVICNPLQLQSFNCCLKKHLISHFWIFSFLSSSLKQQIKML